MKTRNLAILFSATIIVAAMIYGITVFSSPQNVITKPEEILLYNNQYQFTNPHPVKVTDMEPNSAGVFMYPNSYNITDSGDAYQRFLLIRLPSWMGGGNDSISSYRAYSAIGLAEHCVVKYWPQDGRWRIEDPCGGDFYRPIDGYLYTRQGNPTLLQYDIGLPQLDLTVDNQGYIAVVPPTYAQDRNGVIGIGRTIPQKEIDNTTIFLKKRQAMAQEVKFPVPPRLATGEYAQQVVGDWYQGRIGYQAVGSTMYYPYVRYQFCNCSNHDDIILQKESKYSSVYKIGNNLVLATPIGMSVNGIGYNYVFDFYKEPYQIQVQTLKPLGEGLKMIQEDFMNGTSSEAVKKFPVMPYNITRENAFGINATVYHSHKSYSCPSDAPCFNPLVYYLEISSKSRTFLLNYNICDGNSCVNETDAYAQILESSGAIMRLPDLHWNDGDLVDIQVQLPVNGTLVFDKNSAYDSGHTSKFWVELGKSKIISEY